MNVGPDDRLWFRRLAERLTALGAPAGVADAVVREAWAHVCDSGEAPAEAFGDADAYADTVAAGLAAPAARPAGPVLLRASGLAKRYGRHRVLDGVDLAVRAGQVLAVVGENGCGKSTLLRVLAGLDTHDAGTVERFGRVGYCPQQPGLADFLLPDEHFTLFGAGRGLGRRTARDDGRALADGLSWNAGDRTLVRDLSGGTRQKLSLVLAALGEPEVLLLDEPYQGLDHTSYGDFWEDVWMWRDEGRAVVVVTHRSEQLGRVDGVLDLGLYGRHRAGVGVRA